MGITSAPGGTRISSPNGDPQPTDSKSGENPSTLSQGIFYVYKVARVGEKVSIMSVVSIVSRLLATD